MSVVPLRISNVARTSSKLRDPPGTANIPYGYRLSQPGGRSRSSVNFNRDETSRLPGNVTSPPVKHQSNEANGVPGDDEGGPAKMENGEKQAAKNSANDQTAKSISKHPSNEAIKSSQLRGKHSSKKKAEQRVTIFPVNPNVEKDEEDKKVARQLGSFLRTQDFVEKTDRRLLGKKFRNLVDEGITEYERGVEARREKLRASLLAEEKCLTREIIDQAQRGADLRTEETLRRAQELRASTEEKRLAEVRDKRGRQYLERCPEARNRLTRKATLETKYSNLVQIAEKEARRDSERELENLWHELMLRQVEAEEARESEEARRRMAAEKSIVATLEKQIAGKLALREDEKRVKEEEEEEGEKLERESAALEGSSSPARRREKMNQLRRDLDEQASAARRSLAERAREAETVERAFRLVGEAEVARQRASRAESVSRLRREIAAYMSSLEEFKREEARERAEFEAAVTANARQFEAQRDLARQKSRQDRELGMRKVLEAREQQLRDKRANEEEQTRRAAYEAELRLRQAEAESLTAAEAENRKREAALRYGRELMAQREHNAIARRRESEEIEKIHRDYLQRERECEELAERTLSAPDIITPSAIRMMLNECAARRDEAKRKSLCSSRSNAQLPAIDT